VLPWRTVLELYRDRKEKGSETEGGRIEVKKKEVGEEIEVKREGIGEGIGEGIEVEGRGADVEETFPAIKDLTADELEMMMSEEDFIANERECMDESTDFDDETSRSAPPPSIHHPLVDHMGRGRGLAGPPPDTSKPFPLQTFLTLFNRPSTSACVPKPASSTCAVAVSTPSPLEVPTSLEPQPYRDSGVSVSPRMATLLRELADLVALELGGKDEEKREERLKDGSGREGIGREGIGREGSGNDEWLKIG